MLRAKLLHNALHRGDCDAMVGDGAPPAWVLVEALQRQVQAEELEWPEVLVWALRHRMLRVVERSSQSQCASSALESGEEEEEHCKM